MEKVSRWKWKLCQETTLKVSGHMCSLIISLALENTPTWRILLIVFCPKWITKSEIDKNRAWKTKHIHPTTRYTAFFYHYWNMQQHSLFAMHCAYTYYNNNCCYFLWSWNDYTPLEHNTAMRSPSLGYLMARSASGFHRMTIENKKKTHAMFASGHWEHKHMSRFITIIVSKKSLSRFLYLT